jgi:hypothetical protein
VQPVDFSPAPPPTFGHVRPNRRGLTGRGTFRRVLARRPLSPDLAAALLEWALEADSDTERARLLINLIDRRAIDATLAPAFFEALASMRSDFERHRVLSRVVLQSEGHPGLLDWAVEAAAGMRSDLERASFLSEALARYASDGPLPSALLQAVLGISSGFQLRRVLRVLVAHGGATTTQLASVLEGVTAADTWDFELADLLILIAKRYELDDVLRPAFFGAARRLPDELDRVRVMQVVVAQRPPSATVLALLESALDLKPSIPLAKVLLAMAKANLVDDEARPTFLGVTSRLPSEHERGRVLSALLPLPHQPSLVVRGHAVAVPAPGTIA